MLTWQQAVEQARLIVSSKNQNQMSIAKIACEVCEIKKGGNKREPMRTLRDFAKDIGVNSKTLSNWVTAYRNVFEKLDEELIVKSSYSDICEIAKKVNSQTPKDVVLKIARKHLYQDSFDSKMVRYASQLRSIAHNFEHKDAVLRCQLKTIEEILFYADNIAINIRAHNKKAKPKNHSLAYNRSGGNTGSFYGIRLIDKSIKHDDELVYRYLKKTKAFMGPTRIGMTVGKRNNNNASAWALRRLNKLVKFGLAEKNKQGQYKAIKV